MFLLSITDWIFSRYPTETGGPTKAAAWGPLHIITLLLTIGIIIGLALLLRKKSMKVKKPIIIAFSACLLFFEIARRVINLTNGNTITLDYALYVLVPRPWCAISVWCVILAPLVNKKFFYNVTAMCGIINCVIFFASPEVGFRPDYILFEDVYSIATHVLLFISSISIITLGFSEFKFYRESYFNGFGKDLLMIVGIFVYAFIEIYLLKIEKDPLYFMENNGVQKVLGIEWGEYLVLYTVFLVVYFGCFYFIYYLATRNKEEEIIKAPKREKKKKKEFVKVTYKKNKAPLK